MSSNVKEQANSENEKLCLSNSTNIDNCKLALKVADEYRSATNRK